METEKKYLWEYQQLFYISCKLFAERVFNSIIENLFSKILVIGVLPEDCEMEQKVYIEQEEDFYDDNFFKNIHSLAKNLQEVSMDGHVFHTNPDMQKDIDNSVIINSYRDAIKQEIEQINFYDEFKTYVSWPIITRGFNIFLVLQLNNSAYNSFYKLTNEIAYPSRVGISKSIVDSAVNIFFEEIRKNTGSNIDGYDLPQVSEKNIIKSSAENFFYSVSSKGLIGEGLFGLYEKICSISSLMYETKEANGKMIVAKSNHPNVKLDIKFSNKMLLENYRLTRKLLELTEDNLYLICDSYNILGVGHIVGEYNPIAEDLFIINFKGHYKWNLIYDGKVLLESNYGYPQIPKTIMSQEKFTSDVKRIFQNIPEDKIFEMYHCVIFLIQQKKGAILVFSDKAKKEARRLSKEAICIEPQKIDEASIKKFSSIDGAIFMDENCVCYALGAILDGEANDNGDLSRGSRYNSSVRYYESKKKKSKLFIVVISDDGMVDFIPKLKPQVRRYDITNLITELDKISITDKIDVGKYNRQIFKLEELEFYLNQEQCDKVNELRNKIEKRLDKESNRNVKFTHRDLMPNFECDGSCFSD